MARTAVFSVARARILDNNLAVEFGRDAEFFWPPATVLRTPVVAENNHEQVGLSFGLRHDARSLIGSPVSQRKYLAIVTHQSNGSIGDTLTGRYIVRIAHQPGDRSHIHDTIFLKTQVAALQYAQFELAIDQLLKN